LWVLDATPARGKILLRVLGKDSEGLYDLYVDARYRGYIDPLIDAERLVKRVEENPSIEEIWVEEWLKPPFYREWKKIVAFECRSPEEIQEIQERVELLKLGSRVNTYPEILQTTLYRLRIPMCTMLRDSLEAAETMDSPLYNPPPIRWAWVKLLAWYGEALSPRSRVIGFIAETQEGSLRGSIERLSETMEDLKPHIVLYRGPFKDLVKVAARSSGAVFIYIQGVPIGVHGLIEWCRLSYTPLKIVGRYSIGRVLTTIEALRAHEKRYIVPHRPLGFSEPPRRVEALPIFDRGGYIMRPKPGVYFGVVQIDFSSLYPSIISRYNISPETVNDPHCGRYVQAPEAMHRICLERRGLVAEVIEGLISRRLAIKEAMKGAQKHLKNVLDERQEAIKWVLVASFGYLGYRNARFGRIDSYECVTAYARDIAWRTIDAIRRRGYRVIHYIVDSIFIEAGIVDRDEAESIVRIVEDATGFKARVEAIYRWLIIPPTAKGEGASNRYIGKLLEGSMKVKGVDPVRRDTPPLIKRAWETAIEELSKANTAEELGERVLKALDEIKILRKEILRGSIRLEDLVITRGKGEEVMQVIMHKDFYQAADRRGYSPKYYSERLESLEKLLLYILNRLLQTQR